MHRPVTIRSAYWLRRAALLGGVTVWALACASAEKRYKQGLEFEAQGRYPEAAFHYAEALRKEPGLEPARARLRETGPLAIQDLLRRAQTAQSLGRHDEAAEHFLQLDRLLRESAAVGVTLDAPEGYASRRRAALDRAIESMLEAGYAALARGSFNEALAAYARAGERYEPDPTQQAQLLRATFGAWLSWAEAEAASGHFRAAYERAQHAIEVPGIAGRDLARARQLQAAALARGSRHVVALPVDAGAYTDRRMPGDLVPAFEDELTLEYWTHPPLFIEMAAGAEVRQALRRMGFGNRTLSSRDAAFVGRELDADYVVLAEMDSAWTQERDVRRTQRSARTRRGTATSYTIEEGRRRLGVRIAFAVIDAHARRTVDSGHLAASHETAFRQAIYAGDPDELDLSRSERELFERGVRAETERELVEGIVDELAPRLAETVYGRLLRRID